MTFRLTTAAAAVALVLTPTACSSGTPSAGPQMPTIVSHTPAAARTGSVWVADEVGDRLTVIDAQTNSVSATLVGMKQPHNVQVGRDDATVYAVSRRDNVVAAIAATTYEVQAVAPTGAGPAHVIDAPNGKVYVSNSGDGTVSVYRAPGLQSLGRIHLGGMPHGLRPAAGGSVIVVANTGDGALDLIDPTTDTTTARVTIGVGATQVAITATGRYAYASITEPPAVVKVDLAARTVIGTAPVPAAPVQLYLTPDESIVLSANQGTREAPGRTVSMIDTAKMTVRDSVTTGLGPHGVVIDNTGTRAWVTNTYDGTVSVIDLPTSSVLATMPNGAAPAGVSYSPRQPSIGGSPTATLVVPAPSTVAPPQTPDPHGH